jgi:hypothetical protein
MDTNRAQFSPQHTQPTRLSTRENKNFGLDAPDTWDAKSIEAVNRALRRMREQPGNEESK